jgi:Acetyltransferase (GNAT) domain
MVNPRVPGLVSEMSPAKWSDTEDGDEWDDFVGHNAGSFFHTWAWKRVVESKDSRPLYMVSRGADGRILAACPFVRTTGRRLRYLDSLPDSFMAGPVISREGTNASEILQSLPKSVKFTPFNIIAQVQIRAHQQEIVMPMIALGFKYKILYGLFIADLHAKPPEHIWSNGFLKHDRQAVKYYEQQGSAFRFAIHESDYAGYLALNEGATSHPYNQPDFFSKMRANLGDRLKVALVDFQGKVIAGLIVFCDPAASTIHLATMKYLTVKNIHSPVTYMNWEIVNWAAEQGFRFVDFGLWLAEHVSDPTELAYKMKNRFEVDFVPSYVFTMHPMGRAYTMARRFNRLTLRFKGNMSTRNR